MTRRRPLPRRFRRNAQGLSDAELIVSLAVAGGALYAAVSIANAASGEVGSIGSSLAAAASNPLTWVAGAGAAALFFL